MALLRTFFLAMTLYPDVLQKAQDEVDLVVGCDRLPNFEDREYLPYITALIKELFRWEQVIPTGLSCDSVWRMLYLSNLCLSTAVPHLCTREDTYTGYRIPEGSVVIPNTWYAGLVKLWRNNVSWYLQANVARSRDIQKSVFGNTWTVSWG